MSKTNEATTMSKKDKAVTMKLGISKNAEVRYVPDGEETDGLFLVVEMCAVSKPADVQHALHDLSSSIISDYKIYRCAQAKALSAKHKDVKAALDQAEKAEKAAEKAKATLESTLSGYIKQPDNDYFDNDLPF